MRSSVGQGARAAVDHVAELHDPAPRRLARQRPGVVEQGGEQQRPAVDVADGEDLLAGRHGVRKGEGRLADHPGSPDMKTCRSTKDEAASPSRTKLRNPRP